MALAIGVSEKPIISIIKVKRISELRTLAVISSVVPSSLILFTLMMEAIRSPEMSLRTRSTRRNIPEDGTLHSHHRKNLKSYIALTGLAL
jgi:hypothetical protein